MFIRDQGYIYIYIYVPITRREKEIDRSMIYGDDYGEEKKLREDNNSS